VTRDITDALLKKIVLDGYQWLIIKSASIKMTIEMVKGNREKAKKYG